jgi:hypothetical protein
MFRFTIRDVLWLTVVVALGVALWLEHRRLLVAQFALHEQQAELRLAELRARELREQVILPASPETYFKTLERRGWERPRAIDEP